MSDSVWPHRWQPTRLPHPWDSPGKNTGVGCHFFLQCMKVKVKTLSHIRLLVTPWTAAYQAPPSMRFSRQKYWSGVPLPSPVRSMNQGKLEVVKQEMASVNIDILAICELKWTEMGKFNSDDHYIYYCGQESLRRNAVALIVNKRVQNAVLGCNLKNDRIISVRFQGKPFKSQ